jgi:hypothetical protein
MPQAKSAIMVADGDIRVATTAGHIFNFKAKKEKFVPAHAVAECLKYGVRETKRFRNTASFVPGVGTPGAIRSEIQATRRPTDTAVVEEDLAAEPPQTKEPEAKRNEPTYTETEIRVRKAIVAMIEKPNPDEFTNDRPKVNALNKRIPDMSPNASMRDRVWDKMVKYGEIDEDFTVGAPESEDGE